MCVVQVGSHLSWGCKGDRERVVSAAVRILADGDLVTCLKVLEDVFQFC